LRAVLGISAGYPNHTRATTVSNAGFTEIKSKKPEARVTAPVFHLNPIPSLHRYRHMF